ncbi:hypothetical protein BSM4216_2089 [Bacillus smithii]|nr:hypothetical protein BSM4216_2089 [Bacillus smithii]
MAVRSADLKLAEKDYYLLQKNPEIEKTRRENDFISTGFRV